MKEGRHTRLSALVHLGIFSLLVFLWSDAFAIAYLRPSEHALRIIAGIIVLVAAAIKTPILLRERILRSFYFQAICVLLASIYLPTYLTETLLYGQPIRVWLKESFCFCGFFYFVVLWARQENAEEATRHSVVLAIMGGGSTFFFVFLSFFPDMAERFLYASNVASRLGSIRLAHPFLILAYFAFFYSLAHLSLHTLKPRQILHVISLCVFLYYILFVLVSRRESLALMLVLFLFAYRQFPFIKASLLIITAVGLIVIWQLATDFRYSKGMYSLWEQAGDEYTATEGSIGSRTGGGAFLWDKFMESHYVGTGYISYVEALGSNGGVGVQMAAAQYNPSDLGLLSVPLQYGLPGVIIVILVYVRLFQDLTFIQKRTTDPDILVTTVALQLFFLYQLISFSNCFYRDRDVLFYAIAFYLVERSKQSVVHNTRTASVPKSLT